MNLAAGWARECISAVHGCTYVATKLQIVDEQSHVCSNQCWLVSETTCFLIFSKYTSQNLIEYSVIILLPSLAYLVCIKINNQNLVHFGRF